MGTTLQNGVYLPNEGERNCYAGLKTNWEILDQKVADVTALQQAVAGALHREIVASLPTTDIDPNTIYMILSGTSATENVYNEFMYVNNAWELIGTSATDLTNYYTKGEVDGLLLLKANASDLTSHTGDTTIHVTASDKTKWTNSANTHVLRLALSALTPSTSDNSFSNLDDSTALKVGDKVMDTAGVLFEVTAIDTANSTFTIGTALIDLAQDSDVVHTSGNETISGDKVFNNRLIKNIDVVLGTAPSTGKFSTIDIADNNKSSLLQIVGGVYDTGNSYARFFVQNKTADDGTGLSPTGTIRTCGFNINLPAISTSEGQGSITPRANKTTDFGLLNYQWRNLWCEKLFLNGTQLDPSAFALDNAVVHLSGNETIGGVKTFLDVPIPFKSSTAELGVTGGSTKVIFTDKNLLNLAGITFGNYGSSKLSYCRFHIYDKDSNNQEIENFIEFSYVNNNQVAYFRPNKSNFVSLGTINNRWTKVYADEYYYGSNNVEFSTKFVTTDTNQTISGSKTFSSNVNVYNSDNTADTPNIILKNSKAERGSTTNLGEQNIFFLDKDNAQIGNIKCITNSSGVSNMYITCNVSGSDKGVRLSRTPSTTYFRSDTDNDCKLGTVDVRWSDVQTYKVNALEPSSLSLPDLNNGIDISSYINSSQSSTNYYTPPANGWISISINTPVRDSIQIECGGGFRSGVLSCIDPDNSNNYIASIIVPCIKNDTATIYFKSSRGGTIKYAKFYPCQGNV